MTATVRILYAEDNPQDADQTRAHLAEYASELELPFRIQTPEL